MSQIFIRDKTGKLILMSGMGQKQAHRCSKKWCRQPATEKLYHAEWVGESFIINFWVLFEKADSASLTLTLDEWVDYHEKEKKRKLLEDSKFGLIDSTKEYKEHFWRDLMQRNGIMRS